ncbi:proteasome subunit beta type-6-like [Drosophila hydei]|uniref:proteasome endopeptidase complex n=1 Tax=Drosophila hydei TaxID=7224 RepID=A0A6J1L0S5_DROHY|nr:proteasome subunit beta type-6-like [Drosophila hydei]
MYSNDYYGGTTILAAEFDGGVVMGADTRTSCRAYVSNRSADKLTRITDHIYCCRSGSASQTQSLADAVSYSMANYESSLNKPCLVRDAAVHFRNKIYEARKTLLASIIVAGWDEVHGGQVYSVPITGLLVHEPCAVAGSGGSYIQGYVTAHFKPGMSQDATVHMVKTAVNLAIQHDCSSGGVVRIGIITKDGMDAYICCNKDPDMVKFTNAVLWNLEFGEN